MNKHVGANKLKKRKEAKANVYDVLKKTACGAFFSGIRFVAVAALCLALAAGARYLWIWLNTSKMFVVRSVEIEGTNRVSPEEIRRIANVNVGDRMFAIKKSVVKKSIMNNPWIRDVRISRRLPSGIIIKATERKPIALVNAGRVFYMDDHGVLIPLVPASYLELPLISGVMLDSAGTSVSQLSLSRIKTLMALADRTDTSILKTVSQIDFSEYSYVRIKIENSPMIVEIDDSKGAVEWERFSKIMDAIDNSNEGMPRRINLCYSNLGFAQW
jgi:cell division protein FtsQ